MKSKNQEIMERRAEFDRLADAIDLKMVKDMNEAIRKFGAELLKTVGMKA